ncbi:MAG: LexA family transcriptional regulator [Pseudomonadota bacterium]
MSDPDDEPYQRLKLAREEAGFRTAAEAAQAFNWNEVTYRAHESGQNGIRPSVAERYARRFRVSPTWLMFGGPGGPADRLSGAADVPAQEEIIRIPRFRVQLSAGHGSSIFDEKPDGTIPFAGDFFIKKLGRSSSKGLFILDVSGDSMEPTIKKGAIVMVDTHEKVPDGSIMAFREGEFAFLKRLTLVSGGFEITSDNPSLANRTRTIRPTDDSEFQIIGKVCWVAHAL